MLSFTIKLACRIVSVFKIRIFHNINSHFDLKCYNCLDMCLFVCLLFCNLDLCHAHVHWKSDVIDTIYVIFCHLIEFFFFLISNIYKVNLIDEWNVQTSAYIIDRTVFIVVGLLSCYFRFKISIIVNQSIQINVKMFNCSSLSMIFVYVVFCFFFFVFCSLQWNSPAFSQL